MATGAGQWVSDHQYRCTVAGLRVVKSWVDAEAAPEDALVAALGRESTPGDVVIGLATVSRLLAIELAAATGRTEGEVLAGLAEVTGALQSGGQARDR